MHFSLSGLFLLPSLALALPTTASPRQLLPTGQDVRQDVINIHHAVLALDATVQSFNGGPFLTALVEGAPVLAGVAEIHRVNRAGFRHALAALPFSVQDSNNVIDTVVATVNKSIPAATRHLKAKEPAFKESRLGAVVIASLTLLLYDHDTFSAAVLAKSNLGIGEAKIKEGTEAVANIHNAIQDAINSYTVNAMV
ncbi:hypothetical protein T440DRAFT_533080 [Plenodomus tracheiphilus IPT5]|uniref:Uncharacterized protein n=1 Tax=Plenodomus tracheiphilus IPT5 TaxID=1408161 RepID=A0A6A7B280_9PLEO|nr:hypothetical protein T440DRAFT_533080 [Plenodomus tracheiphilus IPT5]